MYQGKQKIFNQTRLEADRSALITHRSGAIFNSFLELENIINKTELARQYFGRSHSWKSPSLRGGQLQTNTYMIMTLDEFRDKHKDNPVLNHIEILKEGDIMRVLNASYIAERFFGKSRSWFSQKLNNHIKNGNSSQFSPKRLKSCATPFIPCP